MEQSSFRNFLLFLAGATTSLMAANLFLFTQGWYLLELTGKKASVGMAWSLYFLPGLVLLPILGKVLKEFPIRKLVLYAEKSRLLLFLLLVGVLSYWPSPEVLYVSVAVFGILVTPYYPVVYTLLKLTSPRTKAAEYSHWFEAAFQFSMLLSVVGSGFLYERLGFIRTLYVVGGLFAISIFFWRNLEVVSNTRRKGSFSIRACYLEFWELTRKLYRKNESSVWFVQPSDMRFGVIHLIPHAVILSANIPILLYVHDIMKKGPIEYSILDGMFSMGAVVAGLFWGKFTQLSESKNLFVLIPLVSSFMLVVFGFSSGKGHIPYLLVLVLAWLLGSAKSLARAKVIEVIPQEHLSQASSLFQFFGNLQTLFLSLVITHFSDALGVPILFLILAFTMFMYSYSCYLYNRVHP
jgi:MFS family permease